METFFIPFFLMLAPVLIVAILLRYRHVQTQARYRMLLQLADKGVALPPQLLEEPRQANGERRRGLVLIATGLGLMAMFLTLPGGPDHGIDASSLWGIGLLPLIVGLGYLASWWLNGRDARGDAPRD